MAFKMKVRTEFHPTPKGGEWSAIDEDTYDGASELHMMGWGATEQEAIEDLERLFREKADYFEIIPNMTSEAGGKR